MRHEALLLYAVFLFLLQFSLHYLAVRFPGVLGFASNIFVADIIDRTNAKRLENGLVPLRVDGDLTEAAEKKAQDMFSKDYWAHVSPDGVRPWSFITELGYDYVYAGENLAKDFQNSSDVLAAWLASPSHRANLLSARYEDIGVAVVNGNLGGFETTLVVQMFGARQTAGGKAFAATPPTSVKEGVTPQPRTVAGPTLEVPGSGVPSSARISAFPEYIVEEISKPLVPVVDVLKFAKSISFAFGFFLLSLFIADGVVVLRRRHIRISGHTLAHIGILLLLLGATWYTSVGAIL